MNNNQKILVTGADGFIGSHLVELLIKKGFKVVALCQYNSFNNLGWLESIPKSENLKIVSGDIRDGNFVIDLCSEIDVIFHLAALIAIPFSYQAPGSYIETNVTGTLNICQAAKAHKTSRILITSTSEVYGSALYVPIDEKHPKQAQSPYSASKIGADALALSFYNSFDLPITIVRPFNTYGPRQSARAIIPTIITQLLSGKKEIKLGDLSPTRDFNYVADTCQGFLSIAGCDQTIGREINIATNSEISVHDVVDLIFKLTNSKTKILHDPARVRPQNSEVNRLCGDNRLLSELTGFKSEYDIEAGLAETINWFKKEENRLHYKADIYNI